MEVRKRTIYKAYFVRPKFQEYPHNSYGQTYGTFTYLHQLGPEDLPLILGIEYEMGIGMYWEYHDDHRMCFCIFRFQRGKLCYTQID